MHNASSHHTAFHRHGARVVVELSGTITSRNIETGIYAIQPDDPRAPWVHAAPQYVFADDIAPPAFAMPSVTIAAGRRACLLLQFILDRLDIEGARASFEITHELADQLAAFCAELEDEQELDEDGYDREVDIWIRDVP